MIPDIDIPDDRKMNQYQLYVKSGLHKSTVGNIINCTYPSVKLRVIHELCQGLGISITEFFQTDLFDENNLEPQKIGITSKLMPIYLYQPSFSNSPTFRSDWILDPLIMVVVPNLLLIASNALSSLQAFE